MIRTIGYEDAAAIVPLMEELGYPTTKEQMKFRLEGILNRSEYQTFVWEHDDYLKGMIGMTLSYAYHSDDLHVRVIAFVVKEEYQGEGIGRSLMDAAEKWGRDKRAKMIMLNSGNRDERQTAHQIYRHYGFQGKATGFYKSL
ncbi:GNAT family N-acetyltransferase [Halobacillus litoralis]|uniref:GNAT family N-acetyltransferase n=1 Tax=Halobacillus litoralis TaxID=45668 RepID=UPI001CFE0902|nr:GNAT family N-acetyltransferase [Halobacillus litoralis]